MEPPEIQTRIAGCLTENELRIISGQARTLQKRLKMIDELDSDYQVSEIELEMLEEWEDMFPDQSTFETRLRRDGVTREKCKKAVSTHRLEDHESLPAWTEDLKELAAMIDDASVAMIDGLHPSEHLSHPDSHRPFGPLTAAVATYARGQLPPTVINTFGENAIEGMVEWFRDRMETRYLRLLYVEFKTYVAYHDEDLAFADPQEFDDPPTEYYEKFVNLLFDGGFAYLCVEYPVFARLLVEQIRQWVDHLEEFCGRFNADRGALSKWLCGHETLGNVTKLVPLADDTHADGRAVMQLVFESGQSVVYKPRSVDAGQAFYEVLQNLEPYLLVPEFVSPSFLSRDEYGWMEWIEQQHPSDEAAIERYYERVGAIICLSYFMNIKDCQTENYLFSGEHPIILDVETALHPYLDLSRRINADIAPVFDESVLLSLLLPFRVDSENGSRSRPDIPRAICGIATSDEQIVIEGITAANITALNTDVMRVEHNPPLVDRSDSVPTVSGESYLPKTYVDTIAKGFRSTYTTIIRLRDEGRLSDEIGFPDIFKSVENRFIFRDTT
jgi:type 2 lantibiotic biosynthesis protein LanM